MKQLGRVSVTFQSKNETLCGYPNYETSFCCGEKQKRKPFQEAKGKKIKIEKTSLKLNKLYVLGLLGYPFWYDK